MHRKNKYGALTRRARFQSARSHEDHHGSFLPSKRSRRSVRLYDSLGRGGGRNSLGSALFNKLPLSVHVSLCIFGSSFRVLFLKARLSAIASHRTNRACDPRRLLLYDLSLLCINATKGGTVFAKFELKYEAGEARDRARHPQRNLPPGRKYGFPVSSSYSFAVADRVARESQQDTGNQR